ncbi:MAG: ABC transporter permease [Clostridiales bacterium]|nr:ABC transporter permease [Clostridiales bacterium]
MLNVLSTQLYRLKKSKLFWALFIVCAVLPFLGALFISGVTSILENNLSGENADLFAELMGKGGERTLSAISSLTSLSSDAALFSLICSSIFLSGEFSGGAIRNMVLANKSRTQIFLSFLSVALVIGFSYLGVSYVSTLLFYGAFIGFGGVTVSAAISSCFTSLFLGVLSIALVQSLVCLFVFSTRKTGPTVAFPILFILFVPSIITFIAELILQMKLFAGQTVSEASLSWVPLCNMTLFDANNVDGALVGKIALYNIPITVLFATLSWVASKKDMK